jgi:hypothetical protein
MKYSYDEMKRLKVIEYFGEYPLMINGNEIPIPRAKGDYKVLLSPQDSEKTTRSTTPGIAMHRDILGILTKVTIVYRHMESAKVNEILGYAGYFDKQKFFELKFFNYLKNKIETKEFYITDIEGSIDNFGKSPNGDITFTFVSRKGE